MAMFVDPGNFTDKFRARFSARRATLHAKHRVLIAVL